MCPPVFGEGSRIANRMANETTDGKKGCHRGFGAGASMAAAGHVTL